MVTVREIAARAGVSLGTVDRVLHDRGRVSPSTAARVRAAVVELGFTPNVFARNLSAPRVRLLGVLMPDPEQDGGYWRAPLSGVERASESLRGYGIALKTAFFDRYDEDSFARAFTELVDAGADGLLMAPVLERAARSALDSLQSEKAPKAIACFDTGLEHPAVRFRVGQDSRRSGRLAARLMLLCRKGEGPVAAVMPDTDNEHIAGRVEGFLGAMAEAGVAAFVLRRPSGSDFSSMERSLVELAGARPAVSGLLVADSTAALAARALLASGLAGLPLIGYDLLEEDPPYLESGAIAFLIAQSPAEQGERGVRTLLDILLRGASVDPDLRLPLTVVTRENYPEYLGRA